MSRRGQVRIGVSGWTYPPWRGDFYPTGLPHRRELEYAASQLSSIEVNGSFYSLQRPSSYQRWAEETPDDFVFTVKGGRFITHMKKLSDVEAPLANFFASGVLALGPKLGPILWQLPQTLDHDADRMSAFFDLLPHTTGEAVALAERHDDRLDGDRVWARTDADRPVRHALEFRGRGYDSEESRRLMRKHHVATVLADTAGRWPKVDADTSRGEDGLRYLRLHGDKELYTSGYDDDALDGWATRIREWREQRDVFVYFDNDVKGYAPHDARRLIERLED